MFDTEGFIKEFIEAAKAGDNEKMKELADKVGGESLDFRFQILTELHLALAVEEGVSEIYEGIGSTLSLMKLVKETQANSAVEEAKVETKAEEVTQDVAADDSAEVEAETTAETEDGNAATVEEQEQKS